MNTFSARNLRAYPLLIPCCFLFLSAQSAKAQPTAPPIAMEIKIGNITCSTGSGNAYFSVVQAEAAYFQMVNDRGGINGRKIKFISLDSGCDNTKSLELAQELVEQDGVSATFSVFGTDTNLAIRAYLNQKQVPQLFVESSSSVFNDPSHFPWTMGLFGTYRNEALAYARYILRNKPNAKIAVLSAEDEVGREFLKGLHDGLGAKASVLIVKEATYERSGNDLEAQVASLQASGADVFVNFTIGSFATQTIRKAFDLDWHPLQFIPNASLSTAAFLEPAGLAKANGIISNARSKGWLRPQARQDPDVQEFLEWMNKYNSQANLRDQNSVAGYERAEALVAVLKACDDDLSRANIMKKAASMDMELGMLRPGIRVKTTADDYQPIKQLFLIQFDGKQWNPIGPIIGE